MVSLIERLKGKAEKAKADAKLGYREMVEAVAGGRDFDEDRAETILRETGRTVRDVERDADRFKHRRELRADVDAMDAARDENAKLQADEQDLRQRKAAALAEATKRIDAEFDPKLAKVTARRSELARIAERGERALAGLTRSAPSHLTEGMRLQRPTAEETEQAYRGVARHNAAILAPWPDGCETLT